MPKQKSEVVDKVVLKYPSRYKVVILNDDYTPMEFVIKLLVEVFHTTLK